LRDELKAANQQLMEAGQTVAKHEPARPKLPGRPAKRDDLAAGTLVIVPRLGRAEVSATPAENAVDVEVRIGPMRAFVPIADVLIDTHRAAAKAQKSRPDGPMGPGAVPGMHEAAKGTGGPGVQLINGAIDGRASARTPERTLDVRGMRVDEAVSSVDQFIDESLLAERDAGFIIHGHGTGALKQAIRAHLKAHKSVSKTRAGESNEGGDGVTVLLFGG
jgi:DNA mismatch repair protein MutS2